MRITRQCDAGAETSASACTEPRISNGASADLSPGQRIRTSSVDAHGSSRTSKWQTNNLYYKVTRSYYSPRLAHVLQPQGTLEGTHPPLAVNGWNQTAFQSPWTSFAVCICCDGSRDNRRAELLTRGVCWANQRLQRHRAGVVRTVCDSTSVHNVACNGCEQSCTLVGRDVCRGARRT